MKHAQTCRCTARIEVEDDDTARVVETIAKWTESHRCLPEGEPGDDRRQGVGFAATQATGRLHHPWGHNTQEVRA